MSLDFTSTDVRSLYVETGIVAATLTDGELLQIRWTDTTHKLYVPYLKVHANVEATFAAIGSLNVRAAKVSSWTVDGTGGTALTLTGNLGKLDTGIARIAIPGVRVATTAALGAGTKTVDGDIGGVIAGYSATLANTKVIDDVVLVSDMSVFLRGVTLNANEGLIVRATAGATGTIRVGMQFGYAVI